MGACQPEAEQKSTFMYEDDAGDSQGCNSANPATSISYAARPHGAPLHVSLGSHGGALPPFSLWGLPGNYEADVH